VDKVTTLYRIYGERGSLLYVGMTDEYERRMRNHSEKWWWREVRRIDTTDFKSRAEAKAAETRAIKSERPLYNRAENTEVATVPTPHIPRRNTKAGQRRLLSLGDAAEYLGVNERTLRRMISAGDLPAYRLGSKTIRVDAQDIDDMLNPIPNAKMWA